MTGGCRSNAGYVAFPDRGGASQGRFLAGTAPVLHGAWCAQLPCDRRTRHYPSPIPPFEPIAAPAAWCRTSDRRVCSRVGGLQRANKRHAG